MKRVIIENIDKNGIVARGGKNKLYDNGTLIIKRDVDNSKINYKNINKKVYFN